MTTLLFVALVRVAPAGYEARFPDLQLCHAEGHDLAALLTHARQSLLACLEALSAAGESWPTPTRIEDIKPQDGATVLLIDVSVDDPPVRVNISIGERLLQRLDAGAESRGMTRSGFIAQAVRLSLGERPPLEADVDAFGRRVQEELSAIGRRINDSIGPDSVFNRRMAELDDRVFDGVRWAADSVSAAMDRRQSATKTTDTTASEERSDA